MTRLNPPPMDNPADVVMPEVAVSPELKALRDELATLHDVFASMNGGNIRASDWPRAERCLGYLNGLITAVQAKADALEADETESH